jgi:YrbI family 3-deoxy-D-manno-octulosonate 8-phosphate phosphatase
VAIVAFVPVRGGSKGIPQKNIKPFLGKPLVYWVLRELENTTLVDKIILASDDEDIIKIVLGFNFLKIEIFHRCSENATDTASTESVILEYINSLKVINNKDLLLLVQATSPFTTSNDFCSALNIINQSNKYDSLISCTRMKRFIWSEEGVSLNYDYMKRPRRQEFDGFLQENGAIYISSFGSIIRSKNRISGNIAVYEMPEYSSIEIDEEFDWDIAELIKGKLSPRESKSNSIKLVATDVDGVLTDSGMYYSNNGDELKKFNTRDGKGFEILKKNNILTVIITSESTAIVTRRGQKLKADKIIQGKSGAEKLHALIDICNEFNIELKNCVYIGDDINCLEILKSVGHPYCPADADYMVKNIPGIKILSSFGGAGVFREVVNKILLK